MENGTKYDVVNLKTGEKLEDYRILVADGEQAGWLCPMDITKVTYGKDYIALADGTKSTATYDRMTNFKDGKAVVNVDGKTIRAIDTTGKTLWSMNFAFDRSKMEIRDGAGDRFTVWGNNSAAIIAGGKRIASSSGGLYLNQYSDTYIYSENTGYYALYNFKGKKLTKTYQNAFDEVGQNIYSRWINDKEY